MISDLSYLYQNNNSFGTDMKLQIVCVIKSKYDLRLFVVVAVDGISKKFHL